VAPLEVADLSALDAHRADDWAGVVVCAASYAVLRQALCLLPSFGAARHVTIYVEEAPSTVRRLGPRRLSYPKLGAATATDDATDGPPTQLSFDFVAPCSLHRVVADHVSFGAHPYSDVPAFSVRAVVQDTGATRWVAGDPTARTVANSSHTWFADNPDLLSYDVVVSTAGRCPPVDVQVVNPGGFRTDTEGDPATVVPTNPHLLVVHRGDRRLMEIDLRRGLSAAQVTKLRYVPYVDLSPIGSLDAVAAAGLVAQFAAAAVPMLCGPLPGAVRELLEPSLVREVEAVDAAMLAVSEHREAAALRIRRPALAHHSVEAALAEFAGQARPEPTVSALLVTRRTEFLPHALAALRAQTHGALEVVVALHGVAAPPGLDAELSSFSSSIVLEEPADAVFGSVLNRATQAAGGTFVAKVDDDDWYGPHHVEDMLAALRWSGAQLVGALDEFVYLAARDLTIRRHDFHRTEKGFGRVAGPTMVLRRDDLLAVGGWRAAPLAVDHSLIHNLRDAGATIFRTHALGFVLCRHGRGHTWNPGDDAFIDTAVHQWQGFHPPAALGDPDAATARLETVRRLAGVGQRPTGANDS